MTSPVRPPVGPVIREPLPFPVLSPVRFLKPWKLCNTTIISRGRSMLGPREASPLAPMSTPPFFIIKYSKSALLKMKAC